MVFFLTAFALVAHVVWWGAGLAMLVTPRRWRRWWPLFAPVCGLCLQSAVVWIGAHTALAGTQVYAWPSEALAAVLLGVGLWQRRRTWWAEVQRTAAVWLALAVTLVVLVIPFASSSKVLTTSSLGSCDAADYAAGARLFQEFASTDRAGFLGLTKVVTLHSVDNFYDHFTRLNHFTPSALIAFNGAILGLAPYQLTGVLTATLLALAVPLVFWLARATFGYGRVVSVWIALIYGLSPLNGYAVYHVATAQLLAAQALALITWAGIALWRGGVTRRDGVAMLGVLSVAFGLVWGSYNFIIIVALVPALAFAGGWAIWRLAWTRLATWIGWMAVPAVMSGVFFAERASGLWERFRLFQQFDFGWRIPALSPEGWFGLVGQPSLAGLPVVARWILGGMMMAVVVWSLVRSARRGSSRGFVVLCVTVPILVGYAFLLIRGSAKGTNASYDAYKLFSVFYPGILAGLCFWVTSIRDRTTRFRYVAAAVLVVVVVMNANVARLFAQRMENPPLIVDRNLAAVQAAETLSQVGGINMRIPDFWQRLWANGFLLRKPQYFETHTYEGRLNTSLDGDWDLRSGVVSLVFPGGDEADAVALAPGFTLVNTRSSRYLHVRLTDGWFETETMPRANSRWRWTREDAVIVVENPHADALKAELKLRARSLVERDLQLWVDGRLVRTVKLDTEVKEVRLGGIVFAPGTHRVELRSPQPAAHAPGDGRSLVFACYGLQVIVRAGGD